MLITYKLLNEFSQIAHFCTTRQGGASVGNYASNNQSPFTGDNATALLQNQCRLASHLGVEVDRLVVPYQNHGTELRLIDDAYFQLSPIEKADYLNGVDALMTSVRGVCIGVTTADCVPLLFFDPVAHVVAVAHAGWRGTCGRIADKTILSMMKVYGCHPRDIRVVIGPSISSQVYEVGMEVIEQFKQSGFSLDDLVMERDASLYLDLWAANRQVLNELGILSQNIEVSGICTFTEHEKFFSARRLGIQSGRMLSGIMLR